MKEKMINLYSMMQAAMKSEKGQGMVEYALMLVFVAIVVTAVYSFSNGQGLQGGLNNAITNVVGKLNTSIGAGK